MGVNSFTMLFFYLIALATAAPLQPIVPNAHGVKNKTHTATGVRLEATKQHKKKTNPALWAATFWQKSRQTPRNLWLKLKTLILVQFQKLLHYSKHYLSRLEAVKTTFLLI